MKNYDEMNGNEKIAYRNIVAGFNFEVGGWYNCYQDDIIEYIPDTIDQAKDIIYDCVISNLYDEGYCGSDKAPKEMRFAGEKFIRDVIDQLFETDGDALALAEIKHWRI
jgi:hypothetical protein